MLDPEDTFEEHVADTLVAGGTLCDRDVVEMVVREAPDRIHELQQWGTEFDEEAGRLALGREGGHSHHRIVHALGDATGNEVMRAVIARRAAAELRNLGKLVHPRFTHLRRRLPRRHRLEPRTWQNLVWAKQTILATGGCGQIYRETTNPPVATGDGHAMAYRAGAELRDMEFMQFHPTVLYIAGSSRTLITEAMRGEGARLVDRQRPSLHARLRPARRTRPARRGHRRRSSRRWKRRGTPCVYLDMTHLDAAHVRAALPRHRRALPAVRPRHHARPHSRSPRRALHDRRRDGRHRRPHHGARPVGRRRSDFQRAARRQSPGVEQSARRAGLRPHAGEGASHAALAMPDDYSVLPIENPVTQHTDELRSI